MNEQTQNIQHPDLINILLEDGLESAIPKISELLMNAAMLLERIGHIGADPNERNVDGRNGYGNGFKPRSFQTAMGKLRLDVPQVRESNEPFRTALLEQGSRSERALKSAIATMYVEGVSTRRVTKIMEKLCGFQVSSGQVSNLTKELDVEFAKWRTRPLPEILYLTLDATYYKVRIDGVVRDCATLIAIGVRREDGRRIIIGVSCALSEAEIHWRDFLNSIRARGIGIPDIVTSDAHTGLRAALRACLGATPWQRCQFHLQKNAKQYITKPTPRPNPSSRSGLKSTSPKASPSSACPKLIAKKRARQTPVRPSTARSNDARGSLDSSPTRHPYSASSPPF
jgi:putative transposase